MKILTFLLISSTVALGAQQLLPPGAVANIQQLNLNQPEWYKKDIVITARPPSQIQPSADSQVKSMRFSEDIYKNLTAVDFNTIFQNFPNLEAVDFWGCEVTPDTLRVLAHYAPNITELNLSKMTLTKDLLEMLPAFPKLTSLIIYGTKITNEGLEIIGKLLPNLKKLNLSYNYEFTNEGLVYLPAGLTFLNLNDCHGITDEGLEFIGQRLPNLKKLYLFDCYEISDKGIKLLKNLKLEELNISRLYKLTTENFLKSVKDMPLTYLKIYDTSINPQARQYLKDRAQQQGRTLVIK